jgi:hypothetical protein
MENALSLNKYMNKKENRKSWNGVTCEEGGEERHAICKINNDGI